MSYHDLSESTLTDSERFEEKNRIVRIIRNDPDFIHKLNQNEVQFVNKIAHASFVTTSQLFWLRDLKDKL